VPVTQVPGDFDDVVRTLRAAGCVFAEDEARLLLDQARSPSQLGALVERRVAGEPLEQVLGWAEFRGLRIHVAPGVFVPRRRTELLVDVAVRAALGGVAGGGRPVVVDACCGSGAIAAAVAAELGAVELFATDVDARAVACARRNLEGLAEVLHGELLEPLPSRLRGRVDVVVACTPYVPTAEVPLMPREARVHEPVAALDGGGDGLDVVRALAGQATSWLRPGGTLVVEAGSRQAQAATAALTTAGLAVRVVVDENRGATAVVGEALVTA
jgi:release factor glutamine methyltransferase